MISQMARFYAVPESRKSVDNVRVAETQFFLGCGIPELKPQAKHSFVSVPDEKHVLCQLHGVFCSDAL